ncbi:MAG: ABC transporter permease [Rhodanobacteraceae bacterium]
MNLAALAFRTLRREWRLPELRTLMLALVLAVVALGVVATLAARVEGSVAAGGAQWIGGDAGVSSASPLPAGFAQQARALDLATSAGAAFPSVAFAGQRSQLLSVSALDTHWPLRGTETLAGASGRQYSGHGPAPGNVYLDHRALVALGLKVGDEVQLGGQSLRVAAELVSEPDGGALFALAPRAQMSLADARAAGLLGTGSRARHRLMVAGAAGAVRRWEVWTKTHLPQGAELISPAQSQERVRSAFDRASAFLRLTALLAALLAGVAIALAAHQYARRKTDEVALLRALGMRRRRVLALLALTLGMLALPAAALGVALTLGIAQAAWIAMQGLIGDAHAALPLGPAGAAALVGLAVLAGFALPPLARLAEVPPVAVFRRELGRRVRRFDALYLVPAAVAVALIRIEGGSAKLALIIAASLAGAAALALGLAALLLWLIRRLVPRAHPALRLGLAALARRRSLTLVQATALALGLTALLLLGIVAPALVEGWRRELPTDTPNWFVLNLEANQRDGFARALQRVGADNLNMLPLAVGKLVAINGHPVDAMHFSSPAAKQWADRQLRLSWSATLPPDNHVIAGQWKLAHPATPQVSVDERWRDLFHLKLGDTMRFEVGEKQIDATVSSIRGVNWRSFRVNFFLLLDPAHARTLPHTYVASFHLPQTDSDRLASVSRAYPNLSLVDVDQLLARIRDIIDQVAGAVRWVLGFSLVAGALVLAAALSASAAERRHEAALLRTLGARRRQLRVTAACEFVLLGLIAAASAVAASAGAGTWLARSVFHVHRFVPPAWPLIGTGLLAAAIVMLLGIAGTWHVATTPPLRLLRRG